MLMEAILCVQIAVAIVPTCDKAPANGRDCDGMARKNVQCTTADGRAIVLIPSWPGAWQPKFGGAPGPYPWTQALRCQVTPGQKAHPDCYDPGAVSTGIAGAAMDRRQ